MLLQENAFGLGGFLNLNAVLTLSFDPAAAIPMKWGAVYMGVFMGFWGLCECNIMPIDYSHSLSFNLIIHSALQYKDHHSGFLVSPFQERGVMTQTYEKKWQGQQNYPTVDAFKCWTFHSLIVDFLLFTNINIFNPAI